MKQPAIVKPCKKRLSLNEHGCH